MIRRFSDAFGKYRDLLLAIALFLVIDLGVLVFNYQSSRLIETDTARINQAGEMRVYSQQLAKAVLTLRQEFAEGMPTQTSLAQISEAYTALVEALDTLRTALAPGQKAFLDDLAALETARALLEALEKNWAPLSTSVQPLSVAAGTALTAEQIDLAATKAVARNIRLMQQADDLTRHLEAMALERARQMRMIQISAILLALANFVFIVFKFLRNLAAADRAAQLARNETERILGTVREGLFLLGADGTIGSQRSASADTLLDRRLAAGEDFFAFLRHRMRAEDARAAQEYIALLFNPRVKASLMGQLNPLREVCLQRSDGSEGFLDFGFEQVRGENGIDALLVSVSDVTEKVLLARELAGAEARFRGEIDALLAILDQDPVAVSTFLDAANERLLGINTALQEVAPSPLAYAQLINHVARTAHGIKGEAGALGLKTLEAAVHAFEDVLTPLRGRSDLSGDDLIPVAVAMNDILEEIAKANRIVGRLLQFATQKPEATPTLDDMLRQIEHLTLRVAEDLGKKVRFESHIERPAVPPQLLRALNEALPQLVRNAVAHGIEAVEERLRAGKPETGLIRLSLDISDDGQLVIAVEDDGRGLDPAALRRMAIEKGLKTPAEVAAMNDQEVAALIFAPGFSTLDSAGTHAGRGDGLTVVKEVAERLGARLQVSSRPARSTRFALLFRDHRWLFAC